MPRYRAVVKKTVYQTYYFNAPLGYQDPEVSSVEACEAIAWQKIEEDKPSYEGERYYEIEELEEDENQDGEEHGKD